MRRTALSSPSARAPQQHGFTLLEMAIVLVIIGLIIGGIVVGQNLIRQGELNSIASDVQNYRGAFYNFRHKYNYLPGDLPTASAYWPSTQCQTGQAISPANTGCNGNGNGQISVYAGAPGSQLIEGYRAWQHLTLAGMISGSYSGVPGTASPGDDIVGINVPTSRIKGVGIAVDFTGDYTGNPDWFNGFYPTGFRIATDSTGAGSTTGELRAPFLKAEEAHSIDVKYDDGIPSTGKWRSWANNTECVTATGGANANIAEYNLQSTIIACHLRVDLE
jgi:prepilin-type N-terminal cleavage/methylation domain-containing protein